MCSIVGFIAQQDSGPDIKLLARIIRANHQRGSDAHGMAWVDSHGRFHVYKRPGPFRDNLHILNAVQSARVVVCHLRFTTHGHHGDNINNHPHPCDGGYFIHNGIVSNHASLISEWGLLPSSECDSEVLGLLTCKFHETKVIQWKRAIEQVDRKDQLALMAVYDRPARLIVARRGKDLRWHKEAEGMYFASLGGGFAHGGKEFRDSQVVEYRWTRDGGGRRERWVGVTPYERPLPVLPVAKSWTNSRSLTADENALVNAARDSYVPIKYRLHQIEKELRAAKRARKQLDKFKATGKQRGCIDGVKYRFDENDVLIVDGDCDGACEVCDLTAEECKCKCKNRTSIIVPTGSGTCPKCHDVVFPTPYSDGSYCSCGYMDRIMKDREMDDDPPPRDVVLFDPARLDKLESR